MGFFQGIKNYKLNQPTSIAPLVVFRVVFGLMMAISGIRFVANGWIEELYLTPILQFKYYGFEWVKVPGETGMYLLFGFLILFALLMALGFAYRISAIGFFCSFTYIELLDKTTYLNHYYFVTLVAGIMIFLPAARNYSIDSLIRPSKRLHKVPRWTIDILKFQLALVYFLAGAAKINADWLLEAMPLTNWLKHHIDMPVIGDLFRYKATAYVFSWFGMLYDLTIPLFLLMASTRKLAYVAVVVFHLLTAALFPIGMFPYIMIVCTIIFFSKEFHQMLLVPFRSKFGFESVQQNVSTRISATAKWIISLFVIVQIVIPFRYLLYPGELFWTEQGFRFGWRVMLIEKTGYAQFYVGDPKTGNEMLVDNGKFLTKLQEKMMSTQPDMILEYAHYLRDYYTDTTISSTNASIHFNIPRVRANVRARLNGRSGDLINDTVNLAAEKRGFHHKTWILPMPR